MIPTLYKICSSNIYSLNKKLKEKRKEVLFPRRIEKELAELKKLNTVLFNLLIHLDVHDYKLKIALWNLLATLEIVEKIIPFKYNIYKIECDRIIIEIRKQYSSKISLVNIVDIHSEISTIIILLENLK